MIIDTNIIIEIFFKGGDDLLKLTNSMIEFRDAENLNDKTEEEEKNILPFKIVSITALEFLENIEKTHSKRTKYYIPSKNKINLDLIRHSRIEKPWTNNHSDSILFNFSQDFESYELYNNDSVSEVVNQKLFRVFESAIKFLDKKQYKYLKKKVRLLIESNIYCLPIEVDDIELSYDLLTKFIEKHPLKSDFRNCWNDILILSKAINSGEELYTKDKLLNQFASEEYGGVREKIGDSVVLKFMQNKGSNREPRIESKNYINRGWDYKIRTGK